jgi:hypothetical protein
MIGARTAAEHFGAEGDRVVARVERLLREYQVHGWPVLPLQYRGVVCCSALHCSALLCTALSASPLKKTAVVFIPTQLDRYGCQRS